MLSSDHQFSPKNNFLPLLFTSCFQTLLSSCLEGYVLLFTDQNMTGAHVQGFMVDMTSCYFPSWKHSRSAFVIYTLLEMLDVLCLRAVVCHFYQQQSSSPTYSQDPPHPKPHTAPDTFILAGFILWSASVFILCNLSGRSGIFSIENAVVLALTPFPMYLPPYTNSRIYFMTTSCQCGLWEMDVPLNKRLTHYSFILIIILQMQ